MMTWNFGTLDCALVFPNSLGDNASAPSYTLIQRPMINFSPNLSLEALLQQRSKTIQAMSLQQKLLSQISQSCPRKSSFGNGCFQQTPTTSERSDQSIHQTEIIQLSPIYSFEMSEEKPTSNLKARLNDILTSFINFYGRDTRGNILECRARYASDKVLVSIFDSLHQKYRSCTKHREDMVRFVLRKAITSLRDSIRDQYGLSAKAASLVFCQKYFSSRFQELAEKKIDLENEDQVLSFLLPYKKNSRNRTANTTFITEIFASEEFYQDYLKFLENIDDILEADNQKRSKKVIDFLVICAQEENFEKIKSYKRLPWLKDWFATVKEIGYELLNFTRTNGGYKKSKCC